MLCLLLQLAFSYILLQVLPDKPTQKELWALYCWPLSVLLLLTNHCRQLSDCVPLGHCSLTTLAAGLRQEIQSQFQIDVHSGTSFSRVKLKGTIYHSQAYQRTKHRNSYSVAYTDNDIVKFGFVRFYLSLQTFIVAVITPLVPADHHCCSTKLTVLSENLVPVISGTSPVVVPVSRLLEKYICIPIDGKMYLAKQPNLFFYSD